MHPTKGVQMISSKDSPWRRCADHAAIGHRGPNSMNFRPYSLRRGLERASQNAAPAHAVQPMLVAQKVGHDFEAGKPTLTGWRMVIKLRLKLVTDVLVSDF